MRKPASMKRLEELGRVRLSPNFFMREMLYSEIADFHGIPNTPDDPDLAIAAGTRLCEELLEPLHTTFGQVSIRSAFRSVAVNEYGHERRDKGYKLRCDCLEPCAPRVGSARCGRVRGGDRLHRDPLVHPALRRRYFRGRPWPGGYMTICRIPTWCSSRNTLLSISGGTKKPLRRIESFAPPKGCLTKPGMPNHSGDHSSEYPGFPKPRLN